MIDKILILCMYLCMGTKTLSVDEEAYSRLCRAKRSSKESFSKVIKRATWPESDRTCSLLLSRISGGVPEEVLNALDQAQKEDRPPESKWNG